MTPPRPRRLGHIALAGVVLGAALAASLPGDATAQDADPSAVQELADRYAPIVMIKQQEHACDDDGEPYEPASVEVVLGNPQIVLRQVGTGDPVMQTAPTAADVSELREGFYLDSPGNALEPGCIYERDFAAYNEGRVPTAYAHVAMQEDRPDQLALQYWFYWYYNDWNNKHEGDWEGIQLLFDVGTVDEALTVDPVSVGYAQHEGGERADWDSSKLDRDGTRPIVFASAGSHASYFGSALYIGRSANEGFGCDNTDGPSRRLDTTAVVLPDEVDDGDPLAWVAFEGRWGERHGGPFNGPTGPADKDRWTTPIDWHDDLRSSSVIVPAGDGAATEVIATFCDIVEWGSGQLIAATTSPLRFGITVIVVLGLALWLVRRTDWSRVDPQPLVARRRAGQILRAAPHQYRRRVGTFAALGVLYLPASVLVALVVTVLSWVPLVGELLGAFDDVDQARAIVAVVIGLVANSALFALLLALVSTVMRDDSPAQSARAAIRETWARRNAFASAFGRALLVVVGLAITVVGLPWALRQYVRYHFFPQAVMVEGADGRRALERSTLLVRGRWWHTAVVAGVLYGAVAVLGAVAGLLALLVFRSLPMWALSGVITLTYSLLVPLSAIAQTLLYGDAAAQRSESAEGERAAHVDGPSSASAH